MKIKFLFKWYDFWVGVFYDKKKNWIYILPLPMVGVILKLPENWRISYIIRIWKIPNYGVCLECEKERATTDYNGCKHYVCERCNNKLNRQFNEEYQ